MLYFLEGFFILPPLERRSMVNEKVRNSIFGEYITSSANNDQYVFYLHFKYLFITGLTLALILYASYTLGISCPVMGWDICITSEGNTILDFSVTFCYLFLAIELLLFKPFFKEMLKRNVDWDSYLLANRKLPDLPRNFLIDQANSNIRFWRWLSIFLYIGSPAPGLFLMSRYGISPSDGYLMFLALVLPMIWSYMWGWFFVLGIASDREMNAAIKLTVC